MSNLKFSVPTPEEIREIEQRAHEMRSQVMLDLILRAASYFSFKRRPIDRSYDEAMCL